MRRPALLPAAATAGALLLGCGSPTMPAAQPLDSTELALPTPPPFTAPDGDDPTGSAGSTEPTESTGGVVITGSTPDSGDGEDGDGQASTGVIASGDWIDVTGNLVGVDSDCGNVASLAAHPDTDQVIAGVALRGLWSLAPQTNGWLPLGLNDGSASILNRMGGIAFDPDDPTRFWEAGIYAAGVFETRDSGETFRQLGDVEHVDSVSVDMTDPDRATMLAGGHERTALYLSTDGGDSWIDVADALPAGAGYTSYPVVLDADTFLVGTNTGDAPGIFRSTDGGATWTRIVDRAVHGAPVVDGVTIAWLTVDGALLVSDDGGRSFSVSESATGGRRPSIVQLPGGRLAAIGDGTIVVSDDLGSTWESVGPELPFDPVGLTFSAERSAFYIWYFTCNSPEVGNPVPEGAIMQLDVELDG